MLRKTASELSLSLSQCSLGVSASIRSTSTTLAKGKPRGHEFELLHLLPHPLCRACRAICVSAKVSAISAEPRCSEVLGLLQVRFSTGVSLCELRSVALVLCTLANLPSPSRECKRRFELMVQWFVSNWMAIVPWISLVQLRDSEGRPIDRIRELVDRHIY
jgi:hypothetical protein